MVGQRSLHEQGQQQPQGLLGGLLMGTGAVLAEAEQIAQQGASGSSSGSVRTSGQRAGSGSCGSCPMSSKCR